MQICAVAYEGKKKIVLPIDPANLRIYLQREVDDVDRRWKAFEEAVPAMERLYQRARSGLEVINLQGEKGLEYLMEDIMNSNVETSVAVNFDALTPDVMKFFAKYLPQKFEQQMTTRLLLNDVPAARTFVEKTYWSNPSASPVEVKFVSTQETEFQNIVILYGEKVAFIDPKILTAVLIKDRSTHMIFRPFFNYIWNKAGPAQSQGTK
jgi:sugar-specific transcriptional regulator TrmB